MHNHKNNGCCSHGNSSEDESCHKCGCGSCSCSCHSNEGSCHKEDFADQLLALADEAWMCALKDKIKEEILRSGGEHLSELAKVVAESNKMRWKNKMSSKKSCCDYKDKIHQIICKE